MSYCLLCATDVHFQLHAEKNCNSLCVCDSVSEDKCSNAILSSYFQPTAVPTVLFKDSAQAANRYIYNHSVNCHSMSAVTDDNSILGSSAMVTIPLAAQIEAIHLYTLSNILIC